MKCSHPYLRDAELDEKTLEGILIGWDAQQSEIITDRLNHAKLRQGTRYWEYKDGQEPAEYKALDATYAVDPVRWLNDLKRSSRRTLENIVVREARRIAKDLTGENRQALEKLVPDERRRSELIDSAYDGAWKIIEDSSNAQLDRVTKKITKMADEGASLKDIETEVRRVVGARSSWRKRVTQGAVQAAAEQVRYNIASEYEGSANGVQLRKQWVSLDDERVRRTHRRADGQIRKMESRFHIGGAWLLFPRDPSGPLHEIMGCRCHVRYVRRND